MHARANSLFANNGMSLKQPVRSAFVSNKKFRSSRDTGAFVSLSRKGSVKIDVTSIFWNLLGTLGADKTSKSRKPRQNVIKHLKLLSHVIGLSAL